MAIAAKLEGSGTAVAPDGRSATAVDALDVLLMIELIQLARLLIRVA